MRVQVLVHTKQSLIKTQSTQDPTDSGIDPSTPCFGTGQIQENTSPSLRVYLVSSLMGSSVRDPSGVIDVNRVTRR